MFYCSKCGRNALENIIYDQKNVQVVIKNFKLIKDDKLHCLSCLSKIKKEESPKYTVKNLIDKLKSIDQDLIVYHEGCDCNGIWNGQIDIDEEKIIINRY